MHQPPPKTALVSEGASYSIRSKAFGLFVVFGLIIFAIYARGVMAASIAEGFSSSQELPLGTVVSVSQFDPGKVEPTNVNNASFIAGIASSPDGGLVTLGEQAGQAFVTINGDSPVLVSDLNGEVREGDLLGPSIISGVAQRTTVVEGGPVLGVALGDFNKDSTKTERVNGREVAIGLVPMRLLLTEVAGRQEGEIPFLQKIGVAVTGSNVSTIRLIIASIIFVTVLFISGVIMFTSIRGTFDSVGRNPLASETIFKHLIHVTVVSSTVLIIGLAAAYLVVAV